ncbi:hypothetical protein [Roseateles amylovorans]|uniref:Uncharacterized protein n=1 Tax=Roseateles amylovorans TaxID=2978473 RepID=A0ABY6B580_9BURK|nr:hypothetical protein [Roseateles amylovorans]UXH80536.1 hypothetical protein N4261_11960 [Roseateles amylovorans]
MAAPLPPPESLDELSAHIDLIELRVVQRDMAFHRHWQSLQHRGKAALAPTRWLLPLAGVGSSWLFMRLFRRKPPRGRHGRHDAPVHAAHPTAHARHAHATESPGHDAKRPEVGLLQTLTLLWGLMPAHMRQKLGPETTQLVLGVVAGFIEGRRRQRPKAGEPSAEAPGAAARSSGD